MSSISFFPAGESQKRWRDHMEHNYISEDYILPCVFQVPDNLRETKPEAYIPQLVGIGPYHHFRPEVQDMGSKKRAAVREYLEKVEFKDFINLVKKSPQDFELEIRSCYDRYLDLDKETLSWIVIVDGVFLLHFIDTCSGPEKLVADVLLLENQIPIILLLKVRKVLNLSFSTSTEAKLLDKFFQFCRKHSPLELTNAPDRKKRAFDKNNHMLHFMYQMIIKNKATNDDNQGQPVQSQPEGGNSQGEDNRETQINRVEVPALAAVADYDDDHDDEESEDDDDNISEIKAEENKGGSKSQKEIERLKSQVGMIAEFGREILGHAVEEFKSALAYAENAGLQVPGNINKVSQILRNLEKTFQLQQHKEAVSADKIEIPSVSRLIAILGIKFTPLPEDHGIGDIALSPDKNEFGLPVIKLGPNSEVILRNLVAYEATASTEQLDGCGPTKLRDYVDLMCGLVKTEKDVQYLREANIIQIRGGLPDQEIVKMCNGIKKSEEKPHKESKVQCSVELANDKYKNAWVVKSFRWVMKKVAGLDHRLKRIFHITVLLLLAIPSYCDIFGFGCRGRTNGLGSLQNLYWGDHYLDLDSQAKLMLPRKVLRY